MESEVKDLKDKIDKLEYVEIKSIKEEIGDIKTRMKVNDVLTKQSIDSYQKMNDTMDSLKGTMIEIAQSVKDSNRVTSELATTVQSLNDKVNKVEDKMDTRFKEVNNRMDIVDEKSKIDILSWVKNNWFGFAMGVGVLVYVATQLIGK